MNKKVNIGEFNQQVTWRQPVKTTGTKGNIKRTYSDYKTDFVQVEPAALNETELAGRMQYTETYVITAHFDGSITNNYQVVYNGEDYNLLHKPTPLNLNTFMQVKAVKIED